MIYLITIHTDEQIELLQKISEDYMRVRMGQFEDLAEDLAGIGSGYTYDESDPEAKAKFSAFIRRRNEAEELFIQAHKASGASRCRNEIMRPQAAEADHLSIRRMKNLRTKGLENTLCRSRT